MTAAQNNALNNDLPHADKIVAAVKSFFENGRKMLPGVHMADQAQAQVGAGNYGTAAALAVGSVADAALGVLTLGEGTLAKQATAKLVSAAEETTTLYRAVSPAEFSSIMNTGKFSFVSGANEMKQFSFSLNEAATYANTATEYAAIMKVDVPSSVIGKFGISYSIDPFIFKNGVVSVEGVEQLQLLNSVAKNIGHAF
ncbi:hypothetical protein [Burkholderia multivorans]|nr:hypothetical protein [Burkholderia multivorans]